jgi:dienelactone hydrolase
VKRLIQIALPLLLLAAAHVAAAKPTQAERPAPAVVEERVAIPVSAQRTMDLHVYSPKSSPKAVIFVSHGAGSSVAAMRKVIDRLVASDFAVLAPLHTDSMTLPAEKRENLQAAFGSRIADMTATAGYARGRFSGVPMGALGYSYGSLIAMMGGGAVDYVAPAKVPEMKAILTFSSPGVIAGLIVPDRAFANLSVPTMMITGTRDTVPGFVTDPAAHLVPFEKSPANGRYALIIDEATHEFVSGSDSRFEEIWTLAMDFYAAHLFGDKSAHERLNGAKPSRGITFRKR